jgi:hypothetical protein
MHYWAKEHFETLKVVAKGARTVPEWEDYATFCEKYERGLRRDALVVLDRFISSMERAPFAARRRFVGWLTQQADGRDGRHRLIPQPLQVRIVEPTLLEWTLVDPQCYEPHLWLGGFDHLRHAHELAPGNELVRKKLVVAILSRVGFSTHELPAGYLGIPTQDLADLAEAEGLLQGLSSSEDRVQLLAEIAEERTLIREYLRNR